MGREGIEKVAVLVQSGIGESAQQFIPLRSLLNGNVGANEAINDTITIGGGGSGVRSSGTLENPNNTGLHMFIDIDNVVGSIDSVEVQVFSTPTALFPSLIRCFRPFFIFPRSGSLDLHRALTDDTNDVTLQRLSGLVPFQYSIDVIARGTTAATVDVVVNFGLIV